MAQKHRRILRSLLSMPLAAALATLSKSLAASAAASSAAAIMLENMAYSTQTKIAAAASRDL